MDNERALNSNQKEKRLYKQFLNSSNPQQEARYKLYKNKLNHLIRIAKRNYYDSKFIMAKNNRKETWKLINEVINKRKSRLSMPQSFYSNGRSITDPTNIANEFCNYFTNIRPNLANRIPTVNSTYNSFLTDCVRESIFLKPTNVAELTEICQSLKSGKASGCDDISNQEHF